MDLSALAPPWLSKDTGKNYLKVIGDAIGTLNTRTKDASKCHFPGQNTTALNGLGDDLVIIRGYLETDDSYAARLQVAHDSWQHAGTSHAVIEQMIAMISVLQIPSATQVPRGVVVGCSSAGTYTHWNWHYDTTPAHAADFHTHYLYARTSTTNWNWDGTFPWWRSFVVLFTEPGSNLTAGPAYGTGGIVYGATTFSVGLNVPPAVAILLRQNLMLWKSAATYYPWVIISFNGGDGRTGDEFSPNSTSGAGNPDPTWARWGRTVDGVVVQSRRATSRYLDGTGTYTRCSEHTET